MTETRPWTEDEKLLLLELADLDLTWAEIGERLGRTRDGVKRKHYFITVGAEKQAEIAEKNRARHRRNMAIQREREKQNEELPEGLDFQKARHHRNILASDLLLRRLYRASIIERRLRKREAEYA